MAWSLREGARAKLWLPALIAIGLAPCAWAQAPQAEPAVTIDFGGGPTGFAAPALAGTAPDRAGSANAAGGAPVPGGAGSAFKPPVLLGDGSGDGWLVRVVTPLTPTPGDTETPPPGVQARRAINLSDTVSGNLVAGAYYDAPRLVLGPTVSLRARFEIGF